MSKDLQTTTPETKPAPRERLVVQDEGPAAYLFDTARFEHMQRIAVAMAEASLIPDHLRGKGTGKDAFRQTVGNCLLIVNQATRWNFDPFAVAAATYVVKGRLGFEGKLIAGVVNVRAGIVGRLAYSFFGTGDGRTVTVAGLFDNEAEPRTIKLSVGQAKTDNSMWRKDPDQKLVYSGVTKWARRHCPEIMLGVLTVDDLERMQVTQLDGLAVGTPANTAALDARATQPTTREIPYNPPTPEEQAESAPPQPSFADAAGVSEPVADSQVNPDVEATEGVDEAAPPEPGEIEHRWEEAIADAERPSQLDDLEKALPKATIPKAAKTRLGKKLRDRRAELN